MRSARRLVVPAAYVVLFVAMAFVAYWRMFNSFQEYDDEGYVELTLRHLLDGGTLYNEINTQYGPFYYLVFGAFFKLSGLAVSTNDGRLLQIGVWLAASFLCGLAAHRATRSVLLGIGTTTVTFTVLGTLVNEPMHPGGLLCLLVALAAFILVVVVPRFPRPGFAALGAVGAATALVKINVGGFVLIACAFAAAMALPGWPSRRTPRALLGVLFVAVAPVLLLPDLGKPSMQNFAVVVAAGAASVALVAWPTDEAASDRDGDDHWWLTLVAGAAAIAFVVVACVLALGTSPAALVDAVLLRPTRQRNVLFIDPQIPDAAVLWAALSVTAAAIVRARPASLSGIRGGLVRVGVGLALWFTTTHAGPLSIGPASSLGLAPLLVWLVAVPLSGSTSGSLWRFVRIGLPAIAVLQTLHAYPVAGSQVGFASVLFPLAGAVCIGDGCGELSAGRVDAGEAGRAVALGLGALAAWSVLMFVIRPATPEHDKWLAGVPLHFDGATRLRLPEDQATTLTDVVNVLRSRHCRLIVSRPTYGSITMWASADAPLGLEPDGWTVQLDAAEQAQVLARLRRRPPDCGLHNSVGDAAWESGAPVVARSMVRYVASFRTVREVGDYDVLAPLSGRSGTLTK